ncbi:MAG: type II toxin-antitoxin system prevent-host-death family antitoxin [Deltaproteobacteria bacterium]|nr:type II toxin-antitoxin system prevent-host-death family antitoxin [Deltaproteobacteria bacterium]
MRSISAKELKNKTGEVLRKVGEGEKVLIMKRGKPWAVLSPVKAEELRPLGLREYEEAWEDIEKALKTSRPRYRTWEEAIRRTRWRA